MVHFVREVYRRKLIRKDKEHFPHLASLAIMVKEMVPKTMRAE